MDADQKQVLIVEDDTALANALSRKLEYAGYAVTHAGNGRECLEILSKKNFYVVLLDLMMPDIDGFQVLETLKSRGKVPKVFVLSNLGQAEDEKRALDLGAEKYFIKSNTPLQQIVEEIKGV